MTLVAESLSVNWGLSSTPRALPKWPVPLRCAGIRLPSAAEGRDLLCLGSPYVFGEQYHRPPLGGIQGEWATAIHPAGPSRVKHASETNAPAHGLGMLAGRGPLYRVLLQRSSTGVCRALGACISGGVLRSVCRCVDLLLLTLCAWLGVRCRMNCRVIGLCMQFVRES